MTSVLRKVAELSADERHVYERVLQQPLQNDQRVLIQLVNAEVHSSGAKLRVVDGIDLLDPYAIWIDLSDEEVADLESEILDRPESRPT
jgi:hypothetical protein